MPKRRAAWLLWRRLRIAWRFRVLPWNVPASAVKYLGFRSPSQADIERGEELARRHGW